MSLVAWLRPRKSVGPTNRSRPSFLRLEDRLTPTTWTVTNLDGRNTVVGSLRYIVDNQAQDGDAINFDPGLSGGTIALQGAVSIGHNVTIDGGNAITVSGSGGYRCFNVNNGNTVTIENLTITRGSGASGSGGGVHLSGGSNLTLLNDTISSCSAGTGGGIYAGVGTTLTLTDCTVETSSATHGGGIFATGATLALTNDTVADNTSGGGLECTNGNLTLSNSTVAGNAGEGLFVGFNEKTSYLYDTILVRNSSFDVEANNRLHSSGGNLYGTGKTMTWNTTASYPDVQTSSPNLGILQNNGGPTDTFALLPGSPALGNGNPNAPSFGTLPTTDQRGFARVSRGSIDIGAFQNQSQLFRLTAPTFEPFSDAGSAASFNLGSFTYSGTSASWSVAVDWGDGTTSTFTTAGTGALPAKAHAYAASGNYSFTITLTDADGNFVQGSPVGVTVYPAVAITGPSGLPAGAAGSGYVGATIVAGGGSGVYTFSAAGGLDGLTLSSAGVLSGTPTAAGSYPFTVTATDSIGGTASQDFTLTVYPALAIAPSSGLPTGTVGNPYAQQISASGGSGGYTFGTTSSLPAGLSLSAAGLLSGTPTAAFGTATITVRVTDSAGDTATRDYSLAVDPPVVLSPSAVPTGSVGTGYTNTTFTASGGSGSGYTFSAAGGLDGLTLSSAGTLSGTPTAAGTFLFTVTATDVVGGSGSQNYALTVNSPSPPAPTPAPQPTPTPQTKPAPQPVPAPSIPAPSFAVGADAGGSPSVAVYNPDGTAASTRTVFDPAFTGGVRTATADFNGDGVPDLVVGTGPGAASLVEVLDGQTGAVLFAVAPFEAGFTGGVFVAAGDLTGDGTPDLVVTPDVGGGPRVRVYDGNGFGLVADFLGIEDPGFRGGARAAVGDLNGDGRADLVVAAGFGGGPRVAAFDGRTLTSGNPQKLFGDIFVFEPTLRNGVYVAVGDVNGDGLGDLILGGGPGGGPRVLALSGADLTAGRGENSTALANFFAGDPGDRGGVRLAAKDLDGDNRADLVVDSGQGAGARAVAYLGKNITASGAPPAAFEVDPLFGSVGGVFVG